MRKCPRRHKIHRSASPWRGFLDTLGNEEASQAKAAAEAIDEFERLAYPVRGIEQRLLPMFGITGVAFVLGLFVFTIGALGWLSPLSDFYRVATPLLLGALPTLAVYYAFRVRKRSRADARSIRSQSEVLYSARRHLLSAPQSG